METLIGSELDGKHEELFDQIIEIGFVVAAVALEVMQHLLDVPYLNMGLFVSGEDDVRRQRELTKPIMFYLFFIFGEFCGVLLFWKYLVDYRERLKYSRLKQIPMDYSIELVHISVG